MKNTEVRKGVTNARLNEDNAGILGIEIVFVAGIIGYLAHSWWVFGGSLIALFIAFIYSPLALVLSVLLSIGWGVFGGLLIFQWFANLSAAIVLGILAAIIGLGVHLSGTEWFNDID